MVPPRQPVRRGRALNQLAQDLYHAMFGGRSPRGSLDKEVPLQTFTPETMLHDLQRARRGSWDEGGSRSGTNAQPMPPAPLSEHADAEHAPAGEDSDSSLVVPAAAAAAAPAAAAFEVPAAAAAAACEACQNSSSAQLSQGTSAAASTAETALVTVQQEALSQLCIDFIAHLQLNGYLPKHQQHEPQAQPPHAKRPPRAVDRLEALCSDGVLPSKLLNVLAPGALDERALNEPEPVQPLQPSVLHGSSDDSIINGSWSNSSNSCGNGTSDMVASIKTDTHGQLQHGSATGGIQVRDACIGMPQQLERHQGVSPEAAAENLLLAHASALSVGCRVEGVDRSRLVEAQPLALLALVSGIICSGVLQSLPPIAEAWAQGTVAGGMTAASLLQHNAPISLHSHCGSTASGECGARGNALGVEGMEGGTDAGVDAGMDPEGWLRSWVCHCMKSDQMPNSGRCLEAGWKLDRHCGEAVGVRRVSEGSPLASPRKSGQGAACAAQALMHRAGSCEDAGTATPAAGDGGGDDGGDGGGRGGLPLPPQLLQLVAELLLQAEASRAPAGAQAGIGAATSAVETGSVSACTVATAEMTQAAQASQAAAKARLGCEAAQEAQAGPEAEAKPHVAVDVGCVAAAETEIELAAGFTSMSSAGAAAGKGIKAGASCEAEACAGCTSGKSAALAAQATAATKVAAKVAAAGAAVAEAATSTAAAESRADTGAAAAEVVTWPHAMTQAAETGADNLPEVVPSTEPMAVGFSAGQARGGELAVALHTVAAALPPAAAESTAAAGAGTAAASVGATGLATASEAAAEAAALQLAEQQLAEHEAVGLPKSGARSAPDKAVPATIGSARQVSSGGPEEELCTLLLQLEAATAAFGRSSAAAAPVTMPDIGRGGTAAAAAGSVSALPCSGLSPNPSPSHTPQLYKQEVAACGVVQAGGQHLGAFRLLPEYLAGGGREAVLLCLAAMAKASAGLPLWVLPPISSCTSAPANKSQAGRSFPSAYRVSPRARDRQRWRQGWTAQAGRLEQVEGTEGSDGSEGRRPGSGSWGRSGGSDESAESRQAGRLSVDGSEKGCRGTQGMQDAEGGVWRQHGSGTGSDAVDPVPEQVTLLAAQHESKSFLAETRIRNGLAEVVAGNPSGTAPDDFCPDELPAAAGPSVNPTAASSRTLLPSYSMPVGSRWGTRAGTKPSSRIGGASMPADAWQMRRRGGGASGSDKDERGLQLRSTRSSPRPVQEPPKPSFGTDALHDPVFDMEEERLLRCWLNSLDPRIQLTSLHSKRMRSGWPLLLAANAVQPGSVNWKRVFSLPFKYKVHHILSVCNCNAVVAACRSWQLPLVNIGGIDIAEGRRMATLSLVWQMMRHHLKLQLLPPGGITAGWGAGAGPETVGVHADSQLPQLHASDSGKFSGWGSASGRWSGRFTFGGMGAAHRDLGPVHGTDSTGGTHSSPAWNNGRTGGTYGNTGGSTGSMQDIICASPHTGKGANSVVSPARVDDPLNTGEDPLGYASADTASGTSSLRSSCPALPLAASRARHSSSAGAMAAGTANAGATAGTGSSATAGGAPLLNAAPGAGQQIEVLVLRWLNRRLAGMAGDAPGAGGGAAGLAGSWFGSGFGPSSVATPRSGRAVSEPPSSMLVARAEAAPEVLLETAAPLTPKAAASPWRRSAAVAGASGALATTPGAETPCTRTRSSDGHGVAEPAGTSTKSESGAVARPDDRLDVGSCLLGRAAAVAVSNGHCTSSSTTTADGVSCAGQHSDTRRAGGTPERNPAAGAVGVAVSPRASCSTAVSAGRWVRSLEDPRLCDTQVLLQLLSCIAQAAVQSRHILAGTTQEAREANARYLLSVARKLGCNIFLLWQDVLRGGTQRTLILLASLMALDLRLQRERAERDQQAGLAPP